MDTKDLLTLGIGLTEPWRVVGQSLDLSRKPSELLLEIEAARGERYPCPECGAPCKAPDFVDFSRQNWESFHVFNSWGGTAAHVDEEEKSFAQLWSNTSKRAVVVDVLQAVRQQWSSPRLGRPSWPTEE